MHLWNMNQHVQHFIVMFLLPPLPHLRSATAKQQAELPPVAPGSIPADTDEFTSTVLENLYVALEVSVFMCIYVYVFTSRCV